MEESNGQAVLIARKTRKYLRWHHFWSDDKFDRKYYLKMFFISLFSWPFVIGLFGHVIVTVNGRKFEYLDQDFMVIFSYIFLWSYLAIYAYYSDNILDILTRMSDFEEFGKPPNFDAVNKRLDFYSLLHYTYMMIICFFAYMSPYFGYSHCKKVNLERHIDEVCGMIPIWMPFDLDHFPVREIFVFFQVFSAYHLYVPFAVMVFAMWEAIQHVILRLKHLRFVLEECLNANMEKTARRKMFAKAVRYHNVIMGYAQLLNDYFKSSNFTFVLLHGFVMGVNLFQILQNPKTFNILYLVGFTGTLTIICHAGQKLIDECTEIGMVVYNADWFNLEVGLQKYVILTIARSQRPVLLQAGAFGVFSLELMVKILKTTYTVVALRNTFK